MLKKLHSTFAARTSVAGISLIELILSISLITLLAASTTPFFTSFIVRNRHETSLDVVLGAFRKAQANSMTGKLGEIWGVCLVGQDIRVFTGSCGSPGFSQDTSIPTQVTISNLTETTFNRRGEPSAELTVGVDSSYDSGQIFVNSAGGIDVAF